MRKIPYHWRPILVISLVLLADQLLKIWIKTNMCLGQEYNVFGSDWFIIHFTENPGMAFGMKFGGDYGKLALSIFRIFAVGGIGWFLSTLVKKKAHFGYILSVALIFAGAMGNIIDCVFYGQIFSDSGIYFDGCGCHDPAVFMPKGGGYAPFLHGRVVDMFYFPIINTHYPSWFPFWGGDELVFFQPVFNIADASISVGVFIILIFQKKFFHEDEHKEIIEAEKPE